MKKIEITRIIFKNLDRIVNDDSFQNRLKRLEIVRNYIAQLVGQDIVNKVMLESLLQKNI